MKQVEAEAFRKAVEQPDPPPDIPPVIAPVTVQPATPFRTLLTDEQQKEEDQRNGPYFSMAVSFDHHCSPWGMPTGLRGASNRQPGTIPGAVSAGGRIVGQINLCPVRGGRLEQGQGLKPIVTPQGA